MLYWNITAKCQHFLNAKCQTKYPWEILKSWHVRLICCKLEWSFFLVWNFLEPRCSCSSPEKFLLTDRRATVPPIVKTVYLLRRKSCAWFGLNFYKCLLCQVKIPDEKNTRHVYLWGKHVNIPLVHFYQPLSAWNSPAWIYRLWVPSSICPSTISFLEIH